MLENQKTLTPFWEAAAITTEQLKTRDVVTASLEGENIPKIGKESNLCNIEKSKLNKNAKGGYHFGKT